MSKPFVHLMGPLLGVALDARQVRNEGRFVRSRCRPNAVLTPVLCEQKGEETFGFGVFALRDLRKSCLGRNGTMGMRYIRCLRF